MQLRNSTFSKLLLCSTPTLYSFDRCASRADKNTIRRKLKKKENVIFTVHEASGKMNVVVPCVGHIFTNIQSDLLLGSNTNANANNQNQTQQHHDVIQTGTKCINDKNNNNNKIDDEEALEGSMTLWMEGTQVVSRTVPFDAAKQKTNNMCDDVSRITMTLPSVSRERCACGKKTLLIVAVSLCQETGGNKSHRHTAATTACCSV